MNDPVLITGASGFIGRRVTAAALQERIPVRVLVRRRVPDWEGSGIEVHEGDVRDQSAVARAVEGCRAVVHLAAALRDEAESEAVNVGGARHLIAASLQAGVGRVIVLSTQSTKIANQGRYARTKAAADALFRNSGLAVTILYPSVVYGETLEGIFGALWQMVRRAPVVPVPGNGRWRSAPVYVGDLARLVIRCLESPTAAGREFDVGGPDVCTLDDLLDRIAEAGGLRRRPKIHIPVFLGLAAARALRILTPKPPLTVSNVLGSTQDTRLDLAPARDQLGFAPIALAEGLSRVLGPTRELLLKREGKTLGEYLMDETVPEEFVSRYSEAHERHLSGRPDRITSLARQWPGTIGILDAGLGWLAPHHPFRQRLLLMAAILEAGPHYARSFLPREGSPAATLWRTIRLGARAAFRVGIGIPLVLIVGRREADVLRG